MSDEPGHTRDSLREVLGVHPNDPNWDDVFRLAVEYGHSDGWSAIAGYAMDLSVFCTYKPDEDEQRAIKEDAPGAGTSQEETKSTETSTSEGSEVMFLGNEVVAASLYERDGRIVPFCLVTKDGDMYSSYDVEWSHARQVVSWMPQSAHAREFEKKAKTGESWQSQ